MPRIAMISPRHATGELARAYRDIRPIMPHVGKLVQICSIRPDWVRLSVSNMVFTLEAGTLGRRDKELLAVATSRAGGCRY